MGDQLEDAELGQTLTAHAHYHRAPDSLRRTISARLEQVGRIEPSRSWWHLSWPKASALRLAGAFAMGVIVALAGVDMVGWQADRPGDATLIALASDHARALVTGSEIEVVSSDRHTVKPWISKTLGVSPSVIDLAAQGFPLRGGRRGFLQGSPVAVLVYSYKEHMIDVYALTQGSVNQKFPPNLTLNGFHCETIVKDGFVMVAVSDVDQPRLDQFVTLLRAPPQVAAE